jgi:phosphate acyltransferase
VARVTPVIALDAMGGDAAPGPELAGAIAVAASGRAEVVVVGDEGRLAAELARLGGAPAGLRVRHASQVVTMDDHPGRAFRAKPDSSLRVAVELVAAGEAQAVVSAGNSGAILAAGLLVLGRLPGVDRPPVVTVLPTPTGPLTLCDAGANVDVRPQALAQFGLVGACYDRVVHRRRRPRVGLVSNGAEPGKGTQLTRAAHEILTEAAGRVEMDYLGYVEGSDLFGGAVDVAVTDGFTGNVVLKTCEGLAGAVFGLIRAELAATARGRLAASQTAPALERVARRLDYAETGGALLAGVAGPVLVAHGRSGPAAIESALAQAADVVERGLVPALAEAIAAIRVS